MNLQDPWNIVFLYMGVILIPLLIGCLVMEYKRVVGTATEIAKSELNKDQFRDEKEWKKAVDKLSAQILLRPEFKKRYSSQH